MNNFLSFIWIYISFFKYFFVILWVILFFDIQLLYYYFNVGSSIFCRLSSGYTYFFLGISLSCLFVTVSEIFCFESFETFVFLFAISLPIKSPVSSAVFWITLFEEVLSALLQICLHDQEVFGCLYHLSF